MSVYRISEHPRFNDYVNKSRYTHDNTQSTIQLRVKNLQTILDYFGDHKILNNPSEKDIFELKEYLIDDREYSDNYVNSILTTLRTWYHALKIKNPVDVNEALSNVSVFKDKTPHVFIYKKTREFNPHKIHWHKNEDLNIRNLAALTYNYFLGVSVNEIQNALISDLDFELCRVEVRRSKVHSQWIKRMDDWDGDEPYNVLFWKMMRFYVDGVRQRLGGGDYLFPGGGGDSPHENTVRSWIFNVTNPVFGEWFTPHLWKHTRLTYLAVRGHDWYRIKAFSGHSDLKVLERYFSWGEIIDRESMTEFGWVADLLDEVGVDVSRVRLNLLGGGL